PTSVMLDLLRHSAAVAWLNERLFVPLARGLDAVFLRGERLTRRRGAAAPLRRGGQALLAIGGLALLAYALARGLRVVGSELTAGQVVQTLSLGLLTLLRVAAVVIAATLIWTPIGVRIGFSPRLARIAQPLVQIGASFPANLVF